MTSDGLGLVPTDSAGPVRGLTQADFLRILSTQLTFQDPMKPMDGTRFMAQMAQFSALEQSRQSNDRLDTLLAFQSAQQSLGLIGRTVEVSQASGTLTGQVTTLSFAAGRPALTVKTAEGEWLSGLSLSQITVVR